MNIGTLLLTLLLEFAVYIFAVKRPLMQSAGYAVIVNIITQPLAQLAFYEFYYSSYYESLGFFPFFTAVELLVITAEMFLLRFLLRSDYKEALRISLLANIFSAGAGLLIYEVLL